MRGTCGYFCFCPHLTKKNLGVCYYYYFSEVEYALGCGCPRLVSPTCCVLQAPTCLIRACMRFRLGLSMSMCIFLHTETSARMCSRIHVQHARTHARTHVPCLTRAHSQWQCLQEARLDAPTSSALSQRWLPARLVPPTNHVLLLGVVKIENAQESTPQVKLKN